MTKTICRQIVPNNKMPSINSKLIQLSHYWWTRKSIKCTKSQKPFYLGI